MNDHHDRKRKLDLDNVDLDLINTNSVCSLNKRTRIQMKLPTATTVDEINVSTRSRSRSRSSTTDSNHNDSSNYSKEGSTADLNPLNINHEVKLDLVEVESQSEIILPGQDDVLSDGAIVSSFIIDAPTIGNITTSTTPDSSSISNEVSKIEAPSLDLVSLDIPSATVVCTEPTPTDENINNINNSLDRGESETFIPTRDAAAGSGISVIDNPVITSESSSNEASKNEGPLDIKDNKEVHTDPEITPTDIKDKVTTSACSGPPQYEADVTYDPEIELQEYSDNCRKNPCHDQFVPVKDFSIDKLPEQFRKKCMVKFIKAMAFLTVRITTFNVSLRRPETHKGSPYPGYKDRGENKMCVRYGTGRVHSIIKETEEGDKKCPCESCKNSESHHKIWGLITVYTAAHVVFDTDEAKQAMFRWGYDSDEVRSWVDFSGLGANSDIDGDTSRVTCYTHDVELIDKLLNMTIRYRICREKVIKEMQAGSELVKLVVLVSHPHGCPKHISIGEWTEQMSEIKHTYTQVCGSDGDSEYNSDNADYEDYDPCNESDQEDLDDSCNESDQENFYDPYDENDLEDFYDDDYDDNYTIVNSETLIKYKFNACTCPGSSGATVFMYGSHDLSCDFPHSGGNIDSNYTGYAFPKE